MNTNNKTRTSVWMAALGAVLMIICTSTYASAASMPNGTGLNIGSATVGSCPKPGLGSTCPPPPPVCYVVKNYTTPLTIIYTWSQPLQSNGLSVTLAGLTQPNPAGQYGALINAKYSNVNAQVLLYPKQSWSFNYGNNAGEGVYVNQTHMGLYSNQTWAQVQLFSWRLVCVPK